MGRETARASSSATSGRERSADEPCEHRDRERTASSPRPGARPGGAGRSPRRRFGARHRETARRARRPCRSRRSPPRGASRRGLGEQELGLRGREDREPLLLGREEASELGRDVARRRRRALGLRSAPPAARASRSRCSSERRVSSAPATTVTTSETSTVPAMPRNSLERKLIAPPACIPLREPSG